MKAWQLSRRTLFFLGILTALEFASIAGVLGDGMVFRGQTIPWTLWPALLVLALLPKRSPVESWRSIVATATLLGFTLATCLKFPLSLEQPSLLFVATTAAAEEVVFRLAIPLFVAYYLRRVGVGADTSIVVSCMIAAIVFAVMPGHVDQFRSLATPLVFVAFATVTSYVVWRSGMIWPAILAHLSVDRLTIEAVNGVVSEPAPAIGVSLTLLAMVLIAGERVRATTREVVVIDLRDAPESFPVDEIRALHSDAR